MQRAVQSIVRGLTLAFAALAVVACGPSSAPGGDADSGAAHANSLVRASGGEPATLDTALAADNAALAVLQDLFEGLTAEAPDGRIVAGAADHWSASPDLRRWVFVLRPDLRWSDGAELTAAAFAAGLDAVRVPDTQAPYAELLASVESIRALDARTVVIELTQPMPYLPALLAMPFAAPRLPTVPTSAMPVSNGPYRIASRRPGENIELVRNRHYHAAGTVAIDRVTYLTLDDINTELNLYRTGRLDITSEVPNTQLDRLRRDFPRELHVAPYLSTYAYAINGRRLADRDARMALALAVDREQITARITGAGETPAFGWVPPGIPGYEPAQFTWTGAATQDRRQQARSLWDRARSRAAAPAVLQLCTDASTNHRRTAVALADHWHSVLGVDVRIVEMEWKAYLATREHPGDCDLLRFGWSADYVDASAFLALFVSGHAQNVPRYTNPRYDDLLAESGREPVAALRVATLRRAESLLLDDAVVIPVFHRVSKRLIQPHVHGAAANPLGHLATRHLRIERAKK